MPLAVAAGSFPCAGPLAGSPRKALEQGHRFVRLDAGTSTEVLKGPALRARRLRIEWSRHLVQAGFLLAVPDRLGVRALGARARGRPRRGRATAGVEAFLPIAALLSLRHLAPPARSTPSTPRGS